MFECRRAGGIGRHTGLKILWTFVRAGSSPALGTSGHDIAGWSSQVARRAHNPKVAGSNPAPATNFQGGVAQMARACGSYPQCHWFDSSRRHQKRKNLSFKRDSENRKAPSRRGPSLTCPHLDHRQEKGQEKRRNHDMGVVCFLNTSSFSSGDVAGALGVHTNSRLKGKKGPLQGELPEGPGTDSP